MNSRHTNKISKVLIACTCRIAKEFVRISQQHYLTEKWSKNLAKHLIRHSPNFVERDPRMIVEHRRRRISQRLSCDGFRLPPKSFAQILYFLIKHFSLRPRLPCKSLRHEAAIDSHLIFKEPRVKYQINCLFIYRTDLFPKKSHRRVLLANKQSITFSFSLILLALPFLLNWFDFHFPLGLCRPYKGRWMMSSRCRIIFIEFFFSFLLIYDFVFIMSSEWELLIDFLIHTPHISNDIQFFCCLLQIRLRLVRAYVRVNPRKLNYRFGQTNDLIQMRAKHWIKTISFLCILPLVLRLIGRRSRIVF